MCGILGIFPWKEIELEVCQKALDRLRRRGPDDEGHLIFQGNSVIPTSGRDTVKELVSEMPSLEKSGLQRCTGFLGHRRLSIIDITPAGHQPMPYAEGSLWIVYNGEVYNYIEIREELQKVGFTFQTQSDTEVILAAYQKWGKDCLEKFNGMWAFCIYDRRKNLLFCARDRFGVKPFYYRWDGKNFAFASEIKALVGIPWESIFPNSRVIIPYLYFGIHDLTEETFFTSISQLPAGHRLEFDLGTRSLQIEKFYHLEFHPSIVEVDPQKEKEGMEKFLALFEDAVRLRLRSDVPVGSCLSGGLDSSAIVCMVRKRRRDDPSFGFPGASNHFYTFTADFPGFSLSERVYAEEVVRHAGVQPHFVSPDSRSLQNDLQDLLYVQEEPFGSLSIYAQYCVMREAHQRGIKVLLDGQGADEILAGYIQKHIPIHLVSLLKNGLWRWLSWDWLTPSYLLRALFLLLPRKAAYFYLVHANNRYFRGREKDVRAILLSYMAQEYEISSLNANLHQEFRVRLPRLLKYEDRNSMAFSVESRLPFLDYRLVEWTMRLPSCFKMHRGLNKYLLRESMKGILPEKVRLRRDKIGFAIPQDQWIGELSVMWKGLLQPKDVFLAEYIDVRKVLQDWDVLLSHERYASRRAILWRIVNLKLWHETFWGCS